MKTAGTAGPIRILLISGSTRTGSTNTAALRTAQAVAPDELTTVRYGQLSDLPAFNPDDDGDRLHRPARHRSRHGLTIDLPARPSRSAPPVCAGTTLHHVCHRGRLRSVVEQTPRRDTRASIRPGGAKRPPGGRPAAGELAGTGAIRTTPAWSTERATRRWGRACWPFTARRGRIGRACTHRDLRS